MATTHTSDGQARLTAKNQSLFRDVNERVMEISERFGLRLPLDEWLCECADESCAERIELTKEEYARVREDGARFAVAPGHVVPDFEEVVARNTRYWTVEKVGEAATVGQAFHPRRGSQAPD
jgi:hypothetical protein